MKTEERLSGALQENILSLLCFDDKNCKMVRHAVTPQLFESSVFREVAGHALDFIDAYGEAIKDHLPDHLESILKGDDERKAATYKRLVDNLYASRDSVNGDYVISQLHKFVRQQNLKSALIRAVEAVDDGRIDQAEIELHKGLSSQSVAFESGLDLSKPGAIANLLEHSEPEGFELGIAGFDELGIIPRRKQLFSFIAPKKAGKSWFITHCLKRALLQRWAAVVVTLEMGEESYGTRLVQSFFSISRRQSEIQVSRFTKNADGGLIDLVREKLERMTLKDDGIVSHLGTRARREFNKRPPFRIKQFPTGSLDLAGLNAYLDGLARFENFTPDVIFIDYPKLMKINPTNLRLELGAMIEGLRGIGITRNCAMVVVGQGNAEAEKATLVTGGMAGEDTSIIATSDVCITYSQTPQEHQLNLARLYASQVRNEEGKFQVLISQAYAIGQFCLDSVRIQSGYFDMMNGKEEGREGRPSRPRGRDHDDDDRPRRESYGEDRPRRVRRD